MSTAFPKTLGLILAGGLARRMGGGDKALIEIGGRTILDRVIETMTPQCDGIILNANGDPARFARFGLAVVPDDIPDFAGPLAGILAGLDWIAAHQPDIEWMAAGRPRRKAACSARRRGHPSGLRQVR
jgi:molybdenum cofactor guanylyltransferase